MIALVIRFMEAMKIFNAIFLLTGGGPAKATESFSIFMYKAAFLNYRSSCTARAAIIVLIVHDDHRFLRITPIAFFAGQTVESSESTAGEVF